MKCQCVIAPSSLVFGAFTFNKIKILFAQNKEVVFLLFFNNVYFLQVRQGFIYDEDQKAVTKSIRDRIAQVMLNRRNVKRESLGEDKREKERQDDEHPMKTEGDDSDKEQQSPETEMEKEKEKDQEDHEEKDYKEEPESSAEVSVRKSSLGRRVIDPLVERLEGIAECGSSPHGTIDEHTITTGQDISEKVFSIV